MKLAIVVSVVVVALVIWASTMECRLQPEPSPEDRRYCAVAADSYWCLSQLGYKNVCK